MPDIALRSKSERYTGLPWFDIELTEAPSGATDVAVDVAMDAGLNTAVFVSLFTDARADQDQPSDPTDLRGWWGDEFGPIGSRLWQLSRNQITDETIAFAQAEASAALEWMVGAGIAQTVTVTATRAALNAIGLVIEISRPAQSSLTFRYALNWAAMG